MKCRFTADLYQAYSNNLLEQTNAFITFDIGVDGKDIE